MANRTDLQSMVLAYAEDARRFPARAGDPGVLDELEQSARSSFSGAFATPAAPVAEYTWKVKCQLPGASPQSERVPVSLPFACKVVGAYPVCRPLFGAGQTNGGGQIATLDDLEVAIDLNNDQSMTQSQGATAPVAGQPYRRDGAFCTLGAYALRESFGLRLLGWRVAGRVNQLGVTFRWAEVGVFRDSLISLDLYITDIERG